MTKYNKIENDLQKIEALCIKIQYPSGYEPNNVYHTNQAIDQMIVILKNIKVEINNNGDRE